MSRSRAAFLGALRILNAAVPERRWKDRFRALLLGRRHALPRELMVSNGGTVVQVGMWRKENLARLSRCVGPSGHVILVEADVGVIEELGPFLADQNLTNVTVVHTGAFNKKGRQMLLVGTSPSFNRVDGTNVRMLSALTEDAFQTSREIEVDTMDNILAELGVAQIDYVEISVNGAEFPVLQGMEGTFPRTRRLFVSGYARSADTSEPTNRRVRDFLSDHGFRTKISRRAKRTRVFYDEQAGREWGPMDGHVFAWRE